MKITINGTGVDLTPALKTYVEGKIGVLGKFLKRWELEGEMTARVELARTTQHHHKGEVFRAEVNIAVPGTVLRAEYADWDIRVAIDKIKHIARREIVQYNKRSGRE